MHLRHLGSLLRFMNDCPSQTYIKGTVATIFPELLSDKSVQQVLQDRETRRKSAPSCTFLLINPRVQYAYHPSHLCIGSFAPMCGEFNSIPFISIAVIPAISILQGFLLCTVDHFRETRRNFSVSSGSTASRRHSRA
jgi:hypothetical protein